MPRVHGGRFSSSNQGVAFPRPGGAEALSQDLLPWLISVDVFQTPISHTNWNTNTATASASAYGFYRASSGAQNDEINYDVVLATGTWTVELVYVKDPSGGIFSVQFDSVEKGTIDSWAASDSVNNRASVTGIAVPNTALIRLKLKMATKNASSAGYAGLLHHIQLRRTA